jgi:hypothetical protein
MTTYAEVDGSQTFVFKVIKEQFTNISDENIKARCSAMRAYGTIKNPLFSGVDIYLCLKNVDIKASQQEIRNATTNLDRNLYKKLWDDEYVKDCSVPDVLGRTNLVNEWGVIHACYLFKGEIPLIFQKFMREVIRQLKETGHASLAEANANLSQQLADEHERAGALERANFEQSHEIKKHADIEDIFENAELQGENEQKMYHLMQKKFLKPVSIYVVDTLYIQSKKSKKRPKSKNSQVIRKTPIKKGQSNFEHFGLSESEEENSADDKSDDDELDYDYHRCNRYNLEADPNEEYYFFIPPWMSKTINQAQVKRGVFKYAFDVHIENKEHYSYMVELCADYDTKTTGVFKTTYSNIIESSQSSFINIATRALRKQAVIDKHVPHELNTLVQQNGTGNPSERKPRKARKAPADSSGSDVDGYNESS